MIHTFLSFLLTVASAPSATGCSVSMGTGLTYLAEPGSAKAHYTLGSVPFEIGLLHHRGAQWYQAGVSWMYGASTAIGARPAKAHLFGFHLDIAQSILSYDYADIKLGAGAVMRYVALDLGAWNGGTVGTPVTPPEDRDEVIATIRAFPSLLIHGSSGGGGLEVIPLRIELGPSLLQVAPSVSYSMLF